MGKKLDNRSILIGEKQDSITFLPKETKISPREAILLLKYGLSPAQYEALDKAANSSCQICGKHKCESKFKNLDVDHCHKLGKVRGLLCQNCNIGLGHFRDDVKTLQKAIIYLGRFEKSQRNLKIPLDNSKKL